MNTKDRKILLNKISEATKAIHLTDFEKAPGSYNFNQGYRYGLEEAAKLTGISYGEIMQAEEDGLIKILN